MAIKCPSCGTEFDVTLFTFDHKIQCDCGEWVDLAVGHQQIGENGWQASEQLTPRMSPYAAPYTSSQLPGRFSIARAIIVLILTVTIAASSILMVGPQIVFIVPLAIVLGVVFALRRSFWSLVCFGYPFTFGLISAGIGYKEIPGYEQSLAFAISIGIGSVGCALIAVGLWRLLPGKSSQ